MFSSCSVLHSFSKPCPRSSYFNTIPFKHAHLLSVPRECIKIIFPHFFKPVSTGHLTTEMQEFLRTKVQEFLQLTQENSLNIYQGEKLFKTL